MENETKRVTDAFPGVIPRNNRTIALSNGVLKRQGMRDSDDLGILDGTEIA